MGLLEQFLPPESQQAPQAPQPSLLMRMLGLGDADATGAVSASQAMQPATSAAGSGVGQYLHDVLTGRIAADAAQSMGGGYDPQRSFAANATDPRGLEQAMNVALGIGPGSIRAYHGSPYDFSAFDRSKIGTGEGAQAYGHGLYFAEQPGVAETYRFLGQPAYAGPASGKHALKSMREAARKGLSGDEAIKFARNDLQYFADNAGTNASRQEYFDALNNLESIVKNTPGRMYEVAIHADPEAFLNWDKPLSKHATNVQEALGWTPKLRAEYDATTRGVDDALLGALKSDADPSIIDVLSRRASELNRMVGVPRDATGADIVKGNSIFDRPSDAARSASLLERGIPGIRYLDQGSRGAGEGTNNYVVFDPSIVEILRKYGLAGLLGGAGAVAAGNPYGVPDK